MSSRCAIAAWLECFQEKPSWCRNEQVCQGRISVKRFERSNGLDTALYKNIPLPFIKLTMDMSEIINALSIDMCNSFRWYTQFYSWNFFYLRSLLDHKCCACTFF